MSRKTEGELLRAFRESLGVSAVEASSAIPTESELLDLLENGENLNAVVTEDICNLLKAIADQKAGKLLPGTEAAVTGRKGKKGKGK